jgi:outer membrane receptor protein involved in Fe transport
MIFGASMSARRWLPGACGAAALICCGQAEAAGAHRYAIPAQPLGSALKAFALSSGRDVVFDPALVRGHTARALTGDFTDEAALGRLLEGAGLTWSLTGAGAFVVRTVPHAVTPPAEAPMLDELIVTASKREERAHDVPSSVSAVSGESLATAGAMRLQDYAGRIPGLAVLDDSLANGSNQLAIRGITTGIGGNPTVGIYIDDAPYGASTTLGGFNVPDLDPQDLERIEVLRGPQGTLYGAGALGGLLKYVTASPDTTRFSGRMEADGSTVDGGGSGYGLRGSVNIPLNARVAVRASAYDREDPGFVDNVLTGEQNLNSGRYYGGRLAIGWQINDAWKLRLSALYQKQRGQGPIVDYDPVTFQPVHGDLKQARAVGTNVHEQQVGVYSLEVEGDLGFARLTSSTSYDKEILDFNIDTSALFEPLIEANYGVAGVGSAIATNSGLDKLPQELRLASPATDRLSWLAGGFYTHEHSLLHQDLALFDPLSGAPVTGVPSPLHFVIPGDFEETAVFADVTWRFTPRFDLTGGVRYSHNSQSGSQFGDGILNGGTTSVSIRSGDESTTWLLTPRWRLSDQTMVYGRLASGYRPGGPNASFGTFGTPLTFGPDKVVNYEVGLKSDLFNRRGSIEIAAYWIDWSDIQVQEVNTLGISYIDNAGTAVSTGVEASGILRPVAGLEIDGSLAFNDGRLTSTVASGLAVARAGDRLPQSPRWSTNLAVQYGFPVAGGWRGVLGAEWRHVGQALGAFPNPGLQRFVHPAYEVVNLRAGVRRDRWSLDLYARNIGDSRGQTADILLGASTRVAVIAPRSFGVALARSF